MKSILFPTDFSELSLEAFRFALAYAHRMHYSIIVFHAYNSKTNPSENLQSVYNQIKVETYKKYKIPFPPIEGILNEFSKDVPIKYIVKEGKFIDTIKQYIYKKEDKIELVIMGTTDKNKFIDIFVEPNSLKLIAQINKPVLAIPKGYNFDGKLDNIVFLVDYKENEKEALLKLVDQAKGFNAKLHILHFDLAHGESIVPLMNTYRETLLDVAYDNKVMVSIDSIDIKKSLHEYCKENKIDLIGLINHRKNFYQRIFTKSLAEDLIINLEIPIMAIYQE